RDIRQNDHADASPVDNSSMNAQRSSASAACREPIACPGLSTLVPRWPASGALESPSGRARWPHSWTSRSSPLLTNFTSSFHSACDSRTVFVPSPMVTPFLVISTCGHSVQLGHRVNLTLSICGLLACQHAVHHGLHHARHVLRLHHAGHHFLNRLLEGL